MEQLLKLLEVDLKEYFKFSAFQLTRYKDRMMKMIKMHLHSCIETLKKSYYRDIMLFYQDYQLVYPYGHCDYLRLYGL